MISPSSGDGPTSAPGDGAFDAPIASAAPGPPAPPPPPPASADADPAVIPPYKVGAGFLEQFDASLDHGGRYGVSRTFVSGGAAFDLSSSLELNLSGAFEYSHYRFEGDGPFEPAPWDDVLTLTLAPRLSWSLSDHWGVSAGPIVQYSGESGASFDDALQWGGVVALRYAFDRDHVIGAGLLALSQLEDDPLFLPVPLLDWNLGDGWRISNVRGPEANPFAGLEIVKRFDPRFEVAGGAAWTSQRFRLSNSGPVPGGIGQESHVPIYGRLTLRPEPWLRFDLVAGVSVLGRVELADSGGDRISVGDADPAPILGIFGSIRF